MKLLFGLTIILALFCLGCDRYLDADTPTEPEPVETVPPTDISLILDDGAVTLSWEHSRPTTIARFKLYRSDDPDAEYVLVDSTTLYTHKFDQLPLNRVYYFKVSSVGTNGIEGGLSQAVSTFVGPMSMILEQGEKYTRNQSVQVRLNVSNDASHVMLSEDSTFADAVYEPFSANTTFELSSGEGVKTVYARILFSNGAVSGELLSDEITLDIRAEISSVLFWPAGPFTYGDTILIVLDAGEIGGTASVSISGGPSVALYDDGQAPDVTAADGIYWGRLIVNPELILTDARLNGSFTDQAGNEAELLSDQVLNVIGTPLPVQLIAVEAISSWEIELTWTESKAGDFDSYRIYRGPSSAVDNSGLPLATVSGAGTTSWTDTTAGASTTYFYRVYVYNGSGQSAGSATMSASTPVNDVPDPVILAGVLVDSTGVRLSWSESNALDFKSYRLYRGFAPMADTTDGTMIELISDRFNKAFVNYAPDATTYYYRVYVFDRQGAYSGSNVVSISK